MKKTILLVLFVAIAVTFKAQQSIPQQEIGLIVDGFDITGLTYMTGTNTSLWRFSALNTTGVNRNYDYEQDSTSTTNNTINFSCRVGKEFRKLIAKNIEFRYGVDVSVGYYYSNDDYTDLASSTSLTSSYSKRSTITPGLNAVVGFNYLINNRLFIGAELNPGINCWFEKNERVTNGIQPGGSLVTIEDSYQASGIGYNLSNTSIQITLAYRLK
jgi:hypothetical protein